jgi:hypothetical protein
MDDTTRFSATEIVLELLREHGLVVLALLALVWQVWFLGEMARSENAVWRKVIDEMRVEMRDDREARARAIEEWLPAISLSRDAAMRTEQLMQMILKNCKETQAAKDMQSMSGMGNDDARKP